MTIATLNPGHLAGLRCDPALNTAPDFTPSDLLRRALVLCADHELNASAYAVRGAALAGATIPASLMVGLSTLSDARHGGLTPKCRAWMDQVVKAGGDFDRVHLPPGFGHPLYPDGDPRTRAIMVACAQTGDGFWVRIADDIARNSGQHPSLDFGLALIERELNLPKGARLEIFAILCDPDHIYGLWFKRFSLFNFRGP